MIRGRLNGETMSTIRFADEITMLEESQKKLEKTLNILKEN